MLRTQTKNLLQTGLPALTCLLLALPVHAGVIFEESFDNQVDWNVNNIYTAECAGNCTTAPLNWNNYRTVPGTSSLKNPTGSIQRLPGALPDHTTGNGKAYIVYNQSVAGVNWPGDSTLVKVLSQDYPELYIRMWIRTQANWKTVSSAQSKVFRTYHWDRSGNIFEFFSSGTVNPAYIWDWSTTSSNNASYMDAYRCDPQETNYYCTASGVPSYQLNDYFYSWGSAGATGKYADAQWHRYDFHLKMNDIGKNNGIMEWWWDGNLMESRTDAQWKAASGSSASIGWNTVSIGGNSNNTFSGSTPADQWYAIDDLTVSTSPIPADYVIGNGSSNSGNTGGSSEGSSSADSVPPVVSISSPTANSTISGTINMSVSASDNTGVSRVEYYLNGSLLSAVSQAPFSCSWNSASVANGSYTLQVKAYDAAGNAGQSAIVNISVSNKSTVDTTPPSISITAPANNAVVSGVVYNSVAASDNVGVVKVEYYVNGGLDYSSSTPPFDFSISTTPTMNGTYTMYAKAYDAAGNVKQSPSISFSINNTSTDTSTPQAGTDTKSSNSLWSDADTPDLIDVGPDSPIELGVKFRSDTSGYITGIRFYKSAANTGNHVANLWSAYGKLLATANYINESASGWQVATFAKPVAISANTVYVASYHTNTGHYSGSLNYFTNSQKDNAPLHALSSGTTSSNGVYSYSSSSQFPSKSWKGSNYWVDVIFRK